ncbi:MAG: insulinase family protein [Elusimicrobia bacterium]|nr:insulinase family protein [Elusimicrobiota bacterium]
MSTPRALLAAALLSLPWTGFAAGSTLVFQQAVLPNGLTVVLHEDHSVPVVAVNLWYKVGSKHEEAGKTGFAHLFEHYMFEGSEHSPNGQYDRQISRMGGEMNATTSNDRTDYYATVPSENLEEVLRLESDRMGFLQGAMSQQNLDKQRKIVKNEKRVRANRAYGGLMEALSALVWPDGHPYRWEVIGSMADLDAASLADVKRFHSTYYRPNNAVLVLSGDIDPPDALVKVRKWFGPIPAGPAPAPLSVPASAAGGRRERVLPDAKAQVPMVILAYRIPGKGQPGWTELSAAAAVLGGGRTSRLVNALQHEQRLVVGVGSGVFGLQESDILYVEASPATGVAPARVVAAIEAELAKLAKRGPSAAELKRVAAEIKTARLDALQRVAGLAASLAEGQAVLGDPGARDALDEAIGAVKARDVKSAAQRTLRPDNAAILTIVPSQGEKP